jgi:hypothetical protein
MKTWIKTLETSDGYLRNAKVSLAEGLTCIIGARGTCKSTIVETLRFVHDLDPARLEDLVHAEAEPAPGRGPGGLLQSTLGSGTAVCTICTIDEHGSTSELRLERAIGGRPRIYREGVLDTSPSAAELPIEIYSQGDLLTIAENPEHRLQLVDRPHARAIGQIKARLQAAQRQIAGIGGELLALRASIREDGRGLAPLRELEQQLESIQRERPTLDARLEKERTAFEQREQLLARARMGCDAFATLFSRALPQAPRPEVIHALGDELFATGIEPAQHVAEHLRRLADAAELLERRLVDARGLVSHASAAIGPLDAAFEDHNQRYRALRRDQEALSASLEQEDRIRAQLRRLYQLRDGLGERQAQLESLLARRDALRREVEGCLDEIFGLRLREIETIAADLGNDISLAIVQGAQANAYVDAIAELLQGTRLKRQREIAVRIAELVTPAELVDIVEQEQAATLAKLASLDESQASRITNHLIDNLAEVLALETLVFDDQLEITMNVGGEVRPVEQLSRGQMATALLPLILRHAEFPLVFDQPEDDLDNRFIFDELVARIRGLRRTRQLVFVTHNANIPVLGDADRVVAMSMATARLAAPPQAGTLDEMSQPILDILEGGAIAFQERRKRYTGML